MDAAIARRVVRAYLLSISIWAVLSLLSAFQYHIFEQDMKWHTTLLDMVMLTEGNGFSYAILTPPIFYLVRRLNSTTRTRWGNLLACAAGLVPFVVLTASVRWALVPPWDMATQRFLPRSAHSPLELIRGNFADQTTMYILIIAAAHAWAYFDRVRRQELERSEFQQALAASELQGLKMQLHPHFLFNTLHGISTLIDTDRASAKTMVVKLSGLLRTALGYSGTDLVLLQEELQFIREYLDLEKMRFGPRLTVIWNISPDTDNVLVPQLILQPLVENALRHGVASSRENGWVEISSSRNGNAVELCVRNNTGILHPKGAGVGLRNTEARLRHLFAGESTLSFAVAEDQTATATIRFPALGITQPARERVRIGLAVGHGSDRL